MSPVIKRFHGSKYDIRLPSVSLLTMTFFMITYDVSVLYSLKETYKIANRKTETDLQILQPKNK